MADRPKLEGRVSLLGEQGFCSKGGNLLCHRMKLDGFYAMPAGPFDKLDHPEVAKEIFIAAKPDFDDFGGARKRLTGEDVMTRSLQNWSWPGPGYPHAAARHRAEHNGRRYQATFSRP